MLVIRLTRVGKKKQPSYRIVVQEKTKDPWGKAIEIIGNYNPRANPKALVIKQDRVKYWLAQGAQPSPTLHNLLLNAKIISGEKRRAAKGGGLSGGKAPAAAKEPAAAEEKKEGAA